MGKGGRDVNAATAGRDGANKSGSRPRTLMSIPTDDEPAADKIVQNRKVRNASPPPGGIILSGLTRPGAGGSLTPLAV
jgi:hypothetical protein